MDIKQWLLSDKEMGLVKDRTSVGRLGFALCLKFFERNGYFPKHHKELPSDVVLFVSESLNVNPKQFAEYRFSERSAKLHRTDIRNFLGVRRATNEDADKAESYITDLALSGSNRVDLEEYIVSWFREQKIELPSLSRRRTIISSALDVGNIELFRELHNRLSKNTVVALRELLDTSEDKLSFTKSDPGRASLETVLSEIEKLKIVRGVCLPDNLTAGISSSRLKPLYLRAGTESTWDFKRHPEHISLPLLALLCLKRRGEIIDALGDLIIQLVHKIKKRAEKKVGNRLVKEAKEVHGKQRLLYKIANAAVNNPDGVISEVLFDIVDKETLNAIIREYQTQGPGYSREVQTVLRQSWSGHYRRMLFPVLQTLRFCSNNVHHQPVIEALDYIRNAEENKQRHIPFDDVPVAGIVPDDLKPLVIETDPQGKKRICRMHYELCLFQALRERLRCKEIWIEEAERYRNPDHDLPQDFDARREHYYGLLDLPESADTFIETLQNQMRDGLKHLNDTLPQNDNVCFRSKGKNRICLSPLDPQAEPEQLRHLKNALGKRWPVVNLLDILKETEMRVGFTDRFSGLGNREILSRDTIRHRMLLCLYGLGTNMGLKPVLSEDERTTYEELRYIKRRYLHKDALRAAIADVANANFEIRQPDILSCPEIGLHKSVKKWKDIAKLHHQNGNLDTVKNLNDLSVMNF